MRFLVVTCVFAALLAPLPAVAAEPTPTATSRPPCGAPPYQSITVDPTAATPGDTATVTIVVRDEPCYPDESYPHEVSLFATREPYRDPAPVAHGTTDSTGRFVYVEQVYASTTYYLSTTDGVRRGGTSEARVTVDRTAGSCSNAIRLSSSAAVPIGTAVAVHGASSDTATVSIAFRKRGQSNFSVRRELQPSGDTNSFATVFAADDDYRLYASNGRCDSQPLLVQVQPVIRGPATVRRQSTVQLLVRAPAGVAVKVYFRRSDWTGFAARRTGTADASGRYVTTYVADADYRYYAVTGPDGRTSNSGLTQLQR